MDDDMNKGELSSHNHRESRADFNIYDSLIASQIKSADYLIIMRNVLLCIHPSIYIVSRSLLYGFYREPR